jgi:valyl-tRNA synthetase
LVHAVREIRNHYNVEPRTELDVSVRCPETTAADFRSLQSFIKMLAGVAKLTTGPDVVKPPQPASHVTPEFEVYVSLKGLIDVAAELKRLEKQLAEKRKFAQALEAKLANTSFVSRAPAEVVQQQREQLGDLHKQIATMEANLRELTAG